MGQASHVFAHIHDERSLDGDDLSNLEPGEPYFADALEHVLMSSTARNGWAELI